MEYDERVCNDVLAGLTDFVVGIIHMVGTGREFSVPTAIRVNAQPCVP